jgi:hypothetical protein
MREKLLNLGSSTLLDSEHCSPKDVTLLPPSTSGLCMLSKSSPIQGLQSTKDKLEQSSQSTLNNDPSCNTTAFANFANIKIKTEPESPMEPISELGFTKSKHDIIPITGAVKHKMVACSDTVINVTEPSVLVRKSSRQPKFPSWRYEDFVDIV